MRRLEPESVPVLVIDVQERLAAAMPAAQVAELTRAVSVLVDAAARLGARVIATEQYPTGLGPPSPPSPPSSHRAGATPDDQGRVLRLRQPRLRARLPTRRARAPRSWWAWRRTSACSRRSAISPRAGVDVHVPLDGVASRRDDHRAAGLDLCRSAGATITTMESVVFDWLRRAGTDAFRHLSKRIR